MLTQTIEGSEGPSARQPASATPPEYEGGIGQECVDAPKAFVEKGGTIVLFNQACTLAFNEFEVPARNAL